MFDRVGTLSGHGGRGSRSAQTGKGLAQSIHGNKSLACNRTPLLGKSKLTGNQGNARHYIQARICFDVFSGTLMLIGGTLLFL